MKRLVNLKTKKLNGWCDIVFRNSSNKAIQTTFYHLEDEGVLQHYR